MRPRMTEMRNGQSSNCLLAFTTLAVLLVLFGNSADAKVGNTTLRRLIENSDEIATVDVDEIGLIHGVRIAMGRVEKSYGRLR